MKRWFEQRHAPKPGSYLCDIAEVGESQVRELKFGTDTHVPFRMFIYNDAGTLRAYMNACPHFNVPLNYLPGELFTTDRRQFICMTHYAKFNLDDGRCSEGPCEGEGLEVIPLLFDGERVLVGN
jgi:nitrite reductase/ring-hydroxylating ferredoxin subunit